MAVGSFALDATFVAANIETKISMPQGAHALASYKRYYASRRDDKKNGTVVGTFIYDPAEPGVLIVSGNELPQVLDGGCNVINLRYSIDKRRILSVRCNGVG